MSPLTPDGKQNASKGTESAVYPYYVESRKSWRDEYGSLLHNLANIALRFRHLATHFPQLNEHGTKLRILDLGAAYGYYAAVLLAQGHDVYAIELAEDAARAASDLLGSERVFRQSVADPFPVDDDSIDLIYAFDLVEHMKNAAIVRMLSECERVLAPQGLLFISTPNNGKAARLFFKTLGLFVPRISELFYGPDHINLLTPTRFRALLENYLRRCFIREVTITNFMFAKYPVASIVDDLFLRHTRSSANIIAVIEKMR